MNNRDINDVVGEKEVILPLRRGSEIQDDAEKKAKKLIVSYEEWEPYSVALKNLRFFEGIKAVNNKEAVEQYELAMKMSTPEGLADIITELEGKLSTIGDIPIDPAFEQLSLQDKIEKLFSDFNNK